MERVENDKKDDRNEKEGGGEMAGTFTMCIY